MHIGPQAPALAPLEKPATNQVMRVKLAVWCLDQLANAHLDERLEKLR